MVVVRRSSDEDWSEILQVVRRAFAKPDGLVEPVEVGLLGHLRTDESWLPRYSLVAVDKDGAVLGYVVCTRGAVGCELALALGPIAVDPVCQGQGIGSALMHSVVAAAHANDESLIALLGSPDYYQRFGFTDAELAGVKAPDPQWGHYFQVRVLATKLQGQFRYPAPFLSLT